MDEQDNDSSNDSEDNDRKARDLAFVPLVNLVKYLDQALMLTKVWTLAAVLNYRVFKFAAMSPSLADWECEMGVSKLNNADQGQLELMSK